MKNSLTKGTIIIIIPYSANFSWVKFFVVLQNIDVWNHINSLIFVYYFQNHGIHEKIDPRKIFAIRYSFGFRSPFLCIFSKKK